jgi:hypothetical protein
MVDLTLLDRVARLLDADDATTVNTSMRLPAPLREAAMIAVEELGVASSTTTLTAQALRAVIETAVMDAALEAHYAQHPRARPSLAEVAQALAVQIGSVVADRPELVTAAAEQLAQRHPEADAHDVLLWAEAQMVALA